MEHCVPRNDSLGFNVLTAGDMQYIPSKLLLFKRMRCLMERLATMYDLIVVDLQPVGAVADAQTDSDPVDGMLIVVQEGLCSKFVMDSFIFRLKLISTKIFVFVVNDARKALLKRICTGNAVLTAKVTEDTNDRLSCAYSSQSG